MACEGRYFHEVKRAQLSYQRIGSALKKADLLNYRRLPGATLSVIRRLAALLIAQQAFPLLLPEQRTEYRPA